MNKTIKIAIIATLIVYCCGVFYTYYSNTKFNERIAFYDKNSNGVIDGKEINKDSLLIINQMSKRKTTKQGLIMFIPLAIIFGLFISGMAFLFRKIKNINDNEIEYGKH